MSRRTQLAYRAGAIALLATSLTSPIAAQAPPDQ